MQRRKDGKKTKYQPLDFINLIGYRIESNGILWTKWIRSGRGKGNGSGTKRVLSNKWKVMKVFSHRDGHILADFIDSNGHKKRYQVHRLVLMAFVGPCPEGMEACHYPDRNPTNNNLQNLRWDTRSNNAKDAVVHGTCHLLGHSYATGINNYNAKLNPEKVRSARMLWATGKYSYRKLGVMFGVGHDVIMDAIKRNSWKSVE